MDTDNTQDGAEPSLASAGSRGSNGLVAYYVHGCEFVYVTLLREHAEASGGTVETLVQITDAEREAIEAARDILREMEDDNGEPFAAELEAISGLLERLG
jgi:hypothetical protein